MERPRYLYLHGFASGPQSRKATFLAEQFAELGLRLGVPDLAQGDFEHLTVTGQLAVVRREVTGGPAVLLGSSLGGYLAALYAARHPAEVERLVLLAPGFTFPTRWPAQLGAQRMAEWRASGRIAVYHYGERRERALAYDLIEDGRQYEDYPVVTVPTLVIHGTRDDVVPAAVSEEFDRRNPAVTLRLVEGGHELTEQLGVLWDETRRFLGV